jgi:hypothetical protein
VDKQNIPLSKGEAFHAGRIFFSAREAHHVQNSHQVPHRTEPPSAFTALFLDNLPTTSDTSRSLAKHDIHRLPVQHLWEVRVTFGKNDAGTLAKPLRSFFSWQSLSVRLIRVHCAGFPLVGAVGRYRREGGREE